MSTEIITLLVSLISLAGVSYLVVRQPRRTLRNGASSILVDTSVLMDGRIVPIAASGFITSTLVIPRSVIGELQFLADHADNDKRSRARAGLDVVRELQDMPTVTVQLLQDGSRAAEGVDERLLNLAKSSSAAICTIDYNLNKVAAVEGLRVLNVNELAQGLRMAYLPGERIVLELVQKGSDNHQAVGYLPDGTMVVVEHAHQYIGKSVEIEFIRSLQTAAGKMMFARRVDRSQAANVKHEASQPQKQRSAGRKQTAPTSTAVTPEKRTSGRRSTRTSQPATGADGKSTSSTAAGRSSQQTAAKQQPLQTEDQAPSRDKSQARRTNVAQENAKPTTASNSKDQTSRPATAKRPARRSHKKRDQESAIIELVNKQ